MKISKIDIRDIKGFRIGNAEDIEGGTGCTVIISEDGAVGGVDVRGGGPATRETDLLRSENTVESINAVVLSGGSAFGLESGSGVMRALAARGVGFKVGDISVPIVCGASLFDLAVGNPGIFPDREMGFEAVMNAYQGIFESGNHGAGTGASCGKMLGMDRAMKTGLGTFACGDDLIQVGAVVAVNACADVYNGAGNIIAGLRTSDGSAIQGTIKVLKGMIHPESEKELRFEDIKIMAAEEKELIKTVSKARESEPTAVKSDDTAPAAPSVTVPETAAASSVSSGNDISDIARAIQKAYELASQQKEEPEQEPVPEPEAQPEETPLVPEDLLIVPETAAPEEEVPEEEIPAGEMPSEAYQAAVVPEQETPTAEPEEVYEAPSEEYAEPEKDEDAKEAEPEAAAETAPEADKGSAEPADEPAPEEVRIDMQEVTETPAVIETLAEAGTEAETPAEPEQEPEQEAIDPYELSDEEKADMGYDIPFNTTIGCLITNAKMTKAQANKLASILHDAYARAIKPVHSTLDGDTIFVMSTCTQEVNFDAFAALATDVMQYAIIDGANRAESAYGLPAARDMARK